jgi:WXG100 family type VII secretion target
VAETTADAAVLAKAAGQFDSVAQSLDSMLKRLMSELSVLEVAWQGLGAQAFTQVKQNWQEQQEKIRQALTETADAIRNSGTTYSTTDDQAAQRVNATNRQINLPL